MNRDVYAKLRTAGLTAMMARDLATILRSVDKLFLDQSTLLTLSNLWYQSKFNTKRKP